jgi:hypothetical protein
MQWLRLRESTWERHANPSSGWSRVPILPLLAVSIWSRAWIGWWSLLPISLVLIWTWLNPPAISAAHQPASWMSKGVLGEQLWLLHRKDAALAHPAQLSET